MRHKSADGFIYKISDKSNGLLYSVSCFDGNGNVVATICDVGEKKAAEDFCRMLNEGKVHPCHFHEIYDDYFG